MTDNDEDFYDIFEKALLLGLMQYVFSSIGMSFFSTNFARDDETLQMAVDMFTSYIKISIIWTIILLVIFYIKYGVFGFILILLINTIIVCWIYYSYMLVFKFTAKNNNLQLPNLRLKMRR
jgi:hypothetical protein